MGNSRPRTMNAKYKKFSLAMRLTRIEQKISLRELAEKVGTTKQVLSRYETGRNEPKLSTAAAIAKALGLKLSDMIGD